VLEHRHRTLRAAVPLRPLLKPIADPERIAHVDVRRRDQLSDEYRHAA
jgi:putative transposase